MGNRLVRKSIGLLAFFLLGIGLNEQASATPSPVSHQAEHVFSAYEPNYILPWYFTEYPYQEVYTGNTPNGQHIQKNEFNFQLSLKVPLWENFFSWPDTLYFAYTQRSFWQVYNDSPFFRETNYQPEIFLSNRFNHALLGDMQLKTVDIGVVHQSNGRGGLLERSWNRAYLNSIFTHGDWMVGVKPWYIFPDSSISKHNPNIADYMGYGETLVAYRYGKSTVSLTLRNEFESGFRRGAEWLTLSTPVLHNHLRGYVYAFSGYGQSLIEYNHYTNAVGVGFAFNDWSW